MTRNNKHGSGVVPNSMRLLYENNYACNSLGETVLSSYHNSSDYTHPMMEGMLNNWNIIPKRWFKKNAKIQRYFNLEITKQKVIITHNNGELKIWSI